ncbi:hypothetical protein LTR78_008818 [Recurvomyces mirabilis]|uniref:Uncharacterized protein n=1 Tax=Recurvomyces mirabilis TaxID=574656 RepID=A0AAE0TPZ8_9PEZI|nr:hypothetical protein LTR78_008818 [Recurvomyces mirabilis]KAK5160946.1 hypothetical protein LTS14_000739 [Recurvomyces mirabilis]
MVLSPSGGSNAARPISGSSSGVDSAIETLEVNGETVTELAADGDIVLRIEHEFPSTGKHSASFRVSTSISDHSKYFELLLQPGRFGEGESISARHSKLREHYKSMVEVPTNELPAVRVRDVGRISSVKSLAPLCADFLSILHGKELQTIPPVANLANLAIVADRFDALGAVREYMRRKKIFRAIDGKTTVKTDAGLSEERVRQRLLIAMMLDCPQWLEKYSARIVAKGWVGSEVDLTEPLWWDLPSRLEEELAYRRDSVLETIQSLQAFFLGQYTSRERQCKLGYDSSPQCDSFQLGEMVRFFTKVGMLKLQGGVFGGSDEPSEPYIGDVVSLLDTLRQTPEYQIDRFHNHCGIRTKILPLLDLLSEAILHIGICSECWANDRQQYAWMNAKRPLLWKRGTFSLRAQSHRSKHIVVREMFTATEREWS